MSKDKDQEAFEGITELVARAIQDAVILKGNGVITSDLIKGLAQNVAMQVVQRMQPRETVVEL